ncbi:MAG: peptidase M14 [Planctomycetota bacterium]|nr:MAG: peptidase M14 [Planctomycetota bacterium]
MAWRKRVRGIGSGLACLVWMAAGGGCAGPAHTADLVTTAERTQYVETGRYDEAVAFCRAVEKGSPWVRVVSIGTTGEGRDMPMVIVSRERAFTPRAAAATGKAIVLISNGIHSGEIEGKDASLALLREVAVSRERAALLDHVVLLILPIFNIDGHERVSAYNRINQNGPKEMGWRCNAQALNLNRDFMKADAPEMRAWLRMYHAWRPHLWFDTHTTDGADWQYDITFLAAFGPEVPAPLAGWVSQRLHPHLLRTLAEDGHCPQIFFDMRDRLDPAKGIDAGNGGFAPRFSTSYGAITNRPSLLVETHMLKPYETRVRATHRLLVRSLELVNADTKALIDAVAAADREASGVASAGPSGRIVLSTAPDKADPGEPITFKGYAVTMEHSPAAGGVYPVWHHDRTVDTPTRTYTRAAPAATVEAPRAYIVPPQWTEVIERLALHGLELTRLDAPRTLEVESYRFEDVVWAARPFEGRHGLTARAVPIRETRTYPAGSVVVRLNQPMSRVAVHLLEPEAPDSLLWWGFFDAIFEQKEYFEDYAMAPIADRMLRESPALAAEFAEWQQAHAEAGARERLEFFYLRSAYWDSRKDVYPVGRVGWQGGEQGTAEREKGNSE